jgi:hypothetical protein
VKSDLGLISVLGYTEKVPYDHKLQQVVFHDTVLKPNSKKDIRAKLDKGEFKTLSFLEFRTGTVFTCAKLSVKSDVPFETQIKQEPLSLKSVKVSTNFNNTKYYKVTDSLNKAHAVLMSVSNPKSKTSAIHYEIARNEFLHMSDKSPIIDGDGIQYDNIFELPKPILDFCRSRYRYPIVQKRTADEMEVDSSVKPKATPSEQSMKVVGDDSVLRTKKLKPSKKAKVSKTEGT